MRPSEVITMARNQTGTSTGLVPDAEAYTYLNTVEADYWRDICNESIGDKTTQFNINLVAWTNTYTLPQSVSAALLTNCTFGINQIVKAWVKLLGTEPNYIPIQIKYIEGYLNLPDFYATQTSTAIPTAYIIDNESIVLFPTPLVNVTAGIQLIWPKNTVAKSTTTEDVEWMFVLDKSVHYVLVEWLKYWFYGKRGSDFIPLAQWAKQNYENEKLRTINQLSNKNILADESFIPDLTYLG